jgi:hypothetical protein
MRTFQCGCRARVEPASNGGLIVYEFYPGCAIMRDICRSGNPSIIAVRQHIESQR